jgi:hypothetical protein
MSQLLTSIFAIFVAAGAPQVQTYPIRLAPPAHAGDNYSLSASGSRLQQSSIMKDGRLAQNQTAEYAVAFEGRVEVIDVDEKGEAIRSFFTVGKFTKTEKGITAELLKPGTVITEDGRLDKRSRVSLKDGVIDDVVREAFETIAPPHRPGAPTDDEIFGTNESKAFGESWSINRVLASEDLKGSGVSAPSESLSGRVALVAKDKIQDIDCLSVSAEMRAEDVTVATIPPGGSMDQGVMRGTFAGCYALTGLAVPKRQSLALNVDMRFKGNSGTPLEGFTIELKLRQKNELISTPI